MSKSCLGPLLVCVWSIAAVTQTACSRPSPSVVATVAPNGALRDESNRDIQLGDLAARAPLTVLFFFDAECPVQKMHDARVRELVAAYEPRGVSFFGVSSDLDADMPAERSAARERGLPSLLEDHGAKVALALGVEFSTHTVVLDRQARVVYSGGLDSDRTRLTTGRERWLEDALKAALAGRPITKPKTEPLGCPLRTR